MFIIFHFPSSIIRRHYKCVINCANCVCCFSGSQFLHLFAEEYYLRKYLLSLKNICDCESSGPDPCSLVAAVTIGSGVVVTSLVCRVILLHVLHAAWCHAKVGVTVM